MPPITILEDDYVSLWYHPDSKIVHHKIHQFLMSSMFQKLLIAGMELMEKHGARKFLSDDRGANVVNPEDIAWADANWYPRAIKAGLKYWAMVLPATAVGSLQLKAVIQRRRKGGLVAEVFTTVEEAMTWLQSAGTAAP
jgi:hypothetical protein